MVPVRNFIQPLNNKLAVPGKDSQQRLRQWISSVGINVQAFLQIPCQVVKEFLS